MTPTPFSQCSFVQSATIFKMKDLNRKAFGGLLSVLLVMGALLFIPAWTLAYWQAWAFVAVFGGSALEITLYLMKKDPQLLERRMRGGPIAEKEMSNARLPVRARFECVLRNRDKPRRLGGKIEFSATTPPREKKQD